MKLIKRIKDKYYMWIEKQYHKRYPIQFNAQEIQITKIPMGNIKGVLSISPYAIEELQEEDIYRKIVETIWPQLKNYIGITCEYDCIAGSTWAVLKAELNVCGPSHRNQDWFSDARRILEERHEDFAIE